MEIYQDEIKDLLSKDQKKRLQLRERTDTGSYILFIIHEEYTHTLEYGLS